MSSVVLMSLLMNTKERSLTPMDIDGVEEDLPPPVDIKENLSASADIKVAINKIESTSPRVKIVAGRLDRKDAGNYFLTHRQEAYEFWLSLLKSTWDNKMKTSKDIATALKVLHKKLRIQRR